MSPDAAFLLVLSDQTSFDCWKICKSSMILCKIYQNHEDGRKRRIDFSLKQITVKSTFALIEIVEHISQVT